MGIAGPGGPAPDAGGAAWACGPDRRSCALWESLSQNHPFVDGNKRTGFAATYTFLAINGLTIWTCFGRVRVPYEV